MEKDDTGLDQELDINAEREKRFPNVEIRRLTTENKRALLELFERKPELALKLEECGEVLQACRKDHEDFCRKELGMREWGVLA